MKIVIAPDSFKDSLSAPEVCDTIKNGILCVNPDIETDSIPIADGGEGTVRVLIAATNGLLQETVVIGPLGEEIKAEWGILGDGSTAVIEMAAASGLPLVPVNKRNPLLTTTYGTGQLILEAVRRGCKRVIVGIGGSATTDFGTGMAQALGVRFMNSRKQVINEYMTGRLMGEVTDIDMSGFDSKLKGVGISVACDVTNPLLGEKGAVYVYSPQKGATPEMCVFLESNMENISLLAADKLKDVRDVPGAGAAGGLGGGLIAFVNAELLPGVDLVLKAAHFEQRIKNTHLIITGEGKVDHQSKYGKVISGICGSAKKYNVPVIAIVGSLDASYQELRDIGLTACFSICSRPMTLENAKINARELLFNTTCEIMNMINLHNKKFLK
ncbi:glycerate kinase [candidate division KSB1 bacterium]|nr:glycerate kinase [candidate division KSB1 bacterium]